MALTAALWSLAHGQAHLFCEAAEVEVVAPRLDGAILNAEDRHAARADEVTRRLTLLAARPAIESDLVKEKYRYERLDSYQPRSGESDLEQLLRDSLESPGKEK